jgi:hypothetical protein
LLLQLLLLLQKQPLLLPLPLPPLPCHQMRKQLFYCPRLVLLQQVLLLHSPCCLRLDLHQRLHRHPHLLLLLPLPLLLRPRAWLASLLCVVTQAPPPRPTVLHATALAALLLRPLAAAVKPTGAASQAALTPAVAAGARQEMRRRWSAAAM